MSKAYVMALLAGMALTSVASAQDFPEAEGNDTKGAATPTPGGMLAGQTLGGSSTASTGAGVDYFLVSTRPLAPAIYRHQLTLTSQTNGFTVSLRGTGQTAAAAGPWPGPVGTNNATEATVQTAQNSSTTVNTNPRNSVWYGFGRGEQVYYRVNGGTATTAPYSAQLSTSVVTPVVIGAYQPGAITISTLGQGHSSDTDFWVYDGNLNAIQGYGCDDESANGGGTGATLQGLLTRNYAPGVYYIAMTTFNLASNSGSPSDDDFRTGAMLDFGDIVLNSSTATGTNMTFSITDSAGTSLQVPNTKANAFDINWFCFEVVPTPGSASLLALAGLAGLRRRR